MILSIATAECLNHIQGHKMDAMWHEQLALK